jgi:hypothetical protein
MTNPEKEARRESGFSNTHDAMPDIDCASETPARMERRRA